MELQIALDRIPLAHALDVTRSVAPLADWIEVGTSLVKRYGVDGLAQVVDAAGGTPVLADLKTADDAAYEFALAYDAGAASATVLGLAADVTLDTAVRIADERGREVVVDLMELSPARRPCWPCGCRRMSSSPRTSARTPRRRACARSTCSARGPTAAAWRWRADSPLPTCPRSRTCPTCG